MATALVLFALVALLGNVHSQFGSPDMPEVCRSKVMDIYFLLDSSTSIYINDYREQLEFVRSVVDRLDVDGRFTRVGVLTFSDNPTTPQTLEPSRFQTNNEVRSRVNEDNLPYLTGLTNTHLAIRYVRELAVMRDDITKAMVVVTDGGSRSQGSTAREAQLAREEGFYMFVVGVGQYRDEAEWRSIATSENFIYNISEFRQLSSVANLLPTRACPLLPIPVGRCDVTQYADVTFAAGLFSDKAFEIIDEFVSKTTDSRGFLRSSFVFDNCENAVRIPINTYQSYCNEFASSSDTTFQEILSQARNVILTSSAQSTSQTLVLFSEYSISQENGQALRSQILDMRNQGVTVVIVDLESHSFSRDLASMVGQNNYIQFNSAPISAQARQVRLMVESTCDALNSRASNLPSFQPN